MAILIPDQLAELRRETAKDQPTINWTKPQINAAIQAIEDFFENNRAALNGAINAGTAPFIFPNPIKAMLVKAWLKQKFDRGG